MEPFMLHGPPADGPHAQGKKPRGITRPAPRRLHPGEGRGHGFDPLHREYGRMRTCSFERP
jgi:hypothetical protein